MEISDDFYLASIKPSYAYYDKKSIEQSTNKPNPKYKLAGQPLIKLELYPFFIITKRKSAYIKELTLCIKRKDWENRNQFHLLRKQSYVAINRCETLQKEDIISKTKDKKNKFERVAKLKDAKYQELKNLVFKLRDIKLQKRMSNEAKKIIGPALEVSKELRKKFGL